MRIIGLTGWSGAGKTTLLKRVLPLLIGQGLRVSTVKHAHHAFEIDVPGKDSFEHRAAGAHEVVVSSARRTAFVREHRDEPEPGLGVLLGMLSPVDLVVVEGFKRDLHPKVEIHRATNGKAYLFTEIPRIKAVVTDADAPGWTGPVAYPDDIAAVAALILAAAEPLADVRSSLAERYAVPPLPR